MKRCVPLEEAAKQVCIESAKPPLIFQLPPVCGRAVLDKNQNVPIYKYPASISTYPVDTGKWGTIPVHIIIPDQLNEPTNIIFYVHGAGWVFGNLHTHEKLVRELAARTGAAVVFPEYSLSPEAKYPTAVEQCYAVLCNLESLAEQARFKMHPATLTIAGDSAGGNIAAALTLLSKQRQGPKIQKQLLYYPVVNACFHTGSYRAFDQGYYLYRAGMMWFWNQYIPCLADRREITACPLRASSCQLQGLPDAMIINAQADVLRDEGQAYAEKLRRAGVDVTALCIQGTIHDFVMLHALDQTNACRSAMDASIAWINRKNREIYTHRD